VKIAALHTYYKEVQIWITCLAKYEQHSKFRSQCREKERKRKRHVSLFGKLVSYVRKNLRERKDAAAEVSLMKIIYFR